MKKHLQTVVGPVMKKGEENTSCRECQTSCQSACKTSCTVGNQVCQK